MASEYEFELIGILNRCGAGVAGTIDDLEIEDLWTKFAKIVIRSLPDTSALDAQVAGVSAAISDEELARYKQAILRYASAMDELNFALAQIKARDVDDDELEDIRKKAANMHRALLRLEQYNLIDEEKMQIGDEFYRYILDFCKEFPNIRKNKQKSKQCIDRFKCGLKVFWRYGKKILISAFALLMALALNMLYPSASLEHNQLFEGQIGRFFLHYIELYLLGKLDFLSSGSQASSLLNNCFSYHSETKKAELKDEETLKFYHLLVKYTDKLAQNDPDTLAEQKEIIEKTKNKIFVAKTSRKILTGIDKMSDLESILKKVNRELTINLNETLLNMFKEHVLEKDLTKKIQDTNTKLNEARKKIKETKKVFNDIMIMPDVSLEVQHNIVIMKKCLDQASLSLDVTYRKHSEYKKKYTAYINLLHAKDKKNIANYKKKLSKAKKELKKARWDLKQHLAEKSDIPDLKVILEYLFYFGVMAAIVAGVTLLPGAPVFLMVLMCVESRVQSAARSKLSKEFGKPFRWVFKVWPFTRLGLADPEVFSKSKLSDVKCIMSSLEMDNRVHKMIDGYSTLDLLHDVLTNHYNNESFAMHLIQDCNAIILECSNIVKTGKKPLPFPFMQEIDALYALYISSLRDLELCRGNIEQKKEVFIDIVEQTTQLQARVEDYRTRYKGSDEGREMLNALVVELKVFNGQALDILSPTGYNKSELKKLEKELLAKFFVRCAVLLLGLAATTLLSLCPPLGASLAIIIAMKVLTMVVGMTVSMVLSSTLRTGKKAYVVHKMLVKDEGKSKLFFDRGGKPKGVAATLNTKHKHKKDSGSDLNPSPPQPIAT